MNDNKELINLHYRQSRIANVFADSTARHYYAVKKGNQNLVKKENRNIVISGILLLESSASCLSHISKKIKIAKRISLKESEALLDMVKNTAVTTTSTLQNISLTKVFGGEEEEYKNHIFMSVRAIKKTIDQLYDLSESCLFRKVNGNKPTEYFNALQDKKLNDISNDIITFFKQNKDIVDLLTQSDKSEFINLGLTFQKSLDRLKKHVEKSRETESLNGKNNVDATIRAASIQKYMI